MTVFPSSGLPCVCRMRRGHPGGITRTRCRTSTESHPPPPPGAQGQETAAAHRPSCSDTEKHLPSLARYRSCISSTPGGIASSSGSTTLS
ncbi:hypothetical protein LZ30DRAFT_734900 [Colletotrichum cereale]|nr:hypothetical protein LZ30DRAFT_734900 [Colletotrichum cereale]